MLKKLKLIIAILIPTAFPLISIFTYFQVAPNPFHAQKAVKCEIADFEISSRTYGDRSIKDFSGAYVAEKDFISTFRYDAPLDSCQYKTQELLYQKRGAQFVCYASLDNQRLYPEPHSPLASWTVLVLGVCTEILLLIWLLPFFLKQWQAINEGRDLKKIPGYKLSFIKRAITFFIVLGTLMTLGVRAEKDLSTYFSNTWDEKQCEIVKVCKGDKNTSSMIYYKRALNEGELFSSSVRAFSVNTKNKTKKQFYSLTAGASVACYVNPDNGIETKLLPGQEISFSFYIKTLLISSVLIYLLFRIVPYTR